MLSTQSPIRPADAAVNPMIAVAEKPHANQFLQGVYAPVAAELTLTKLEVTGAIPPALNGRYLRIGPNPVTPPTGYHWFAGDGMVHGLAVRDGKALWYRNRWIRSRGVSSALGEAPAPGPRHGPSDTVNTNVAGFGSRTWALVEAGAYPVELTDTLDTLAHNPFDGTLAGAFTAHPHRDPLTGESHAITYDAMAPTRIHHVVVSDAGAVLRELAVPVADGPSIHDCAITARFVLIFDLPVTFSRPAAMAGRQFPYRWNAAHPPRVGLLPRSGCAADIIWCDVDPCYAFHTANAFDLPDGRLVVDLVAYDSMFADSEEGPDAAGRLERWTIDPTSRSVDRRVIDAAAQEFPRIDERRIGQPYRYAYAASQGDAGFATSVGTRLYKHDLQSGTRQIHDFSERRFPGEFVFVPTFAEAAEDEGWLIGLVVDMESQKSDLVILDAQAFEGEPVASIHIPHRVPAGFHGNWLAAIE